MKLGKVSETILRRSVLKEIHNEREEIIVGAGVGKDCAIFTLKEDEVCVSATNSYSYDAQGIGIAVIYNVANNLAIKGAKPTGVSVTIMLPERARESHLKKVMAEITTACKEVGMEVIGGTTEVSNAVTRPIVSATAYGTLPKELAEEPSLKAEQDLVVTKWIGLQGTGFLANEGAELLRERFPRPFVEQAQSLLQYQSCIKEAERARELGVTNMHDISRMGIFGALWEFIRESNLGFEVFLKEIPIRQETVEVSEFFGINPYLLDGSGALLMAADQGEVLVEELAKEGIEATVIGRIKEGNDKLMIKEDQAGCLEAPKLDEIYKAFEQIEQLKQTKQYE